MRCFEDIIYFFSEVEFLLLSFSRRSVEPLEPFVVVPSDGLECAPEAVAEVQPDGYEPNQVEDGDSDAAEGALSADEPLSVKNTFDKFEISTSFSAASGSASV